MTATLRSPFNLSAHLRPTVGDQKISFTSVDHMGWMLCDGRTLSTTDYGLLFGVIGYIFDTDLSGTSSFRLPDFRGTVPGIAGQPSFSNDSNNVNPTTYAIGTRTGEQRHKLTIDEMPSHKHGSVDVSGNTNGDGVTSNNGLHNHEITDPGHTHPYSNQSQTQTIFAAATPTTIDAADNVATSNNTGSNVTGISIINNGLHNHYIGSTGGSNYHNNMQPTLFGGNMFIYSGKNMQAYFPYTWVNTGTPTPPAFDSNVATVPGNVLIF